MAAKLNIDNTAYERESFLYNRQVDIYQFEELVQAYKEGRNKHFLHALFVMIKNQDTFVANVIKNGHRFADLKAEKATFNKYCRALRGIFGDAEFEDMFVKWKKRCSED